MQEFVDTNVNYILHPCSEPWILASSIVGAQIMINSAASESFDSIVSLITY